MSSTRRSWVVIAILTAAGIGLGIAFGPEALDEVLPEAAVVGGVPVVTPYLLEEMAETPEELALMAEVVFIGELIRYDPAVYVIPADAEDPTKTTTTVDGIVFRPVDVLKGSVSDEVVVGTASELRSGEGELISRIDELPMSVLRGSIDRLGTGTAADRFMVFASVMHGTTDIYAFNSTGGVVQVLPDGRFSPAANPPFVVRPGGESPLDRTVTQVAQAIRDSLLDG